MARADDEMADREDQRGEDGERHWRQSGDQSPPRRTCMVQQLPREAREDRRNDGHRGDAEPSERDESVLPRPDYVRAPATIAVPERETERREGDRNKACREVLRADGRRCV